MKRKSQCPKQKASECIDCKKRFKILTEGGGCFSCHLNKYGKIGKEWKEIGKGSRQPMSFKKSKAKRQRPATSKGRVGIHMAKDNLR